MTPPIHSGGSRRPRRIESLAELGLSAEDWAAVVRQGVICCEYRRGGGPYYKLRFRRAGGQQAVRYLGKDELAVAAMRMELLALRRPRQHTRYLKRLNGQARQLIRHTKRALAHDVESSGFHFHGLQIRKRSTDTEAHTNAS